MICYNYQLEMTKKAFIDSTIRLASAQMKRCPIYKYFKHIFERLSCFLKQNTILLQVFEIPAPKITALDSFELNINIIITVQEDV